MRKLSWWCVWLMPVMVSITASHASSDSKWSIDLGIQNVGTQVLERATVVWGKYSFPSGFVLPMKEKVYVGFDRPIPDEATVRFSVRNGVETSKTVIVKSEIPAEAYKDKDMTVMFNVNSCTYDIDVIFYHHVYVDDYDHDIPYDTSNENARVYEIWVSNETEVSISPVLMSGDCRNEFPVVTPHWSRVTGWAPFRLDRVVSIYWKEGLSNGLIQEVAVPMSCYWDKRREIKRLSFVYKGNGIWAVKAYDFVSEDAKLILPFNGTAEHQRERDKP